MKKYTLLLLFCFVLSVFPSFSNNNNNDPISPCQMNEMKWLMDNPKGKWKIRFVRTDFKADTTNKPKGFFNKLKDIVNILFDASDNPPFKVEIVREKEKAKKN
jgi:hypothetical protein